MSWDQIPQYTFLNVIPEYIALVFTIVLWFYSREASMIPTYKNRVFEWCIRIVGTSIIASIVALHLTINHKGLPLPLVRTGYDLFHLLVPTVMIAFSWYVIAVIWEDREDLSPWLMRSLIPYLLYVVLLMINHPTGIVFTVTAEHGYQYGPAFFAPYVTAYIYILLMLILILIGQRRITRSVLAVLLTFPLLMLILVIVQQFNSTLVLTGSASALSLIIIYLNLQNKQLVMDDLTNLPRRKAFLKMLELGITKEQDMAIIMISLNDFKLVNDKFGEQQGDIFLQTIAGFLRKSFTGLHVYRFSGDEFTVLIPQREASALEDTIRTIVDRFAKPWQIDKLIWKLTASVAVVRYPLHATSVKDIVIQLEHCIDLARHLGKGRVVRADESTFDQIKRRNQIHEIMRIALEQHKFSLHFQPVYSLTEKRYVSAEALLRLYDRKLGWISPGEMIPLAEESGMIVDIGYYVLECVCDFINRLERENIQLEGVAVNFSTIQFAQDDLIERVLQIIDAHQVPASKVHVEITESLFIGQFDRVKKLMMQLNQHGITFSLDDFGTGYSNLVNVVELPFSYIKFDKQFLRNAVSNPKSLSVMSAMAEAFHEVGSKIVVEGVESVEQQTLAYSINADQIQGFLYAKPMPPDEFIEFVRQS